MKKDKLGPQINQKGMVDVGNSLNEWTLKNGQSNSQKRMHDRNVGYRIQY